MPHIQKTCVKCGSWIQRGRRKVDSLCRRCKDKVAQEFQAYRQARSFGEPSPYPQDGSMLYEEYEAWQEWERLKNSSREEREAHLRQLGFSEEDIESLRGEEIPFGVMLLVNRPLTPEEQAHAESLVPTISED